MSKANIYENKAEGESLKLRPKAMFSTEYKERKNLRVAAYCRVSTDRNEQKESYETQVAHYRKYITEQEDWIFAGIYADEGISGTSIKKRKDFNRMIADAKAGKFDMIITKGVDRFSRNILDGLTAARDLLHHQPPVGVLFEDLNFSTFRPDSEFMLSIMLLMAQGESERKSIAIKRAFQWRCDGERYQTPVDALLGYEKDENKKIVIEQEGAKTIKAIYAMFLYGLPATRIAFLLTLSGKITGRKRKNWTPSSVILILRNEKYCGDVVAQKTVTTNVLEHKSERNTGQSVLHYKDDHHEGIVSRAEYIRALLLLRANSASGFYNPHYEIEIVCEGLLKGFIPINLAFGGYEAEHYLGAELVCKFDLGNYAVDILSAPDYRLIRSQEIEHRLAAQMTISHNGITFNSDCISRLPGTEFAEILFHPSERLIAVRPTSRSNKNAIPWNTKNLSSSMFCPILFNTMGWNDYWKYKVMADSFVRGNERVLVFNLSEPEFQFVEELSQSEEIIRRIRRLLQPLDWRDNIGADYVSQIISSRRAYALSLDDWKIDAPALPIEGFPGNPVSRSENELISYLETLGVAYV